MRALFVSESTWSSHLQRQHHQEYPCTSVHANTFDTATTIRADTVDTGTNICSDTFDSAIGRNDTLDSNIANNSANSMDSIMTGPTNSDHGDIHNQMVDIIQRDVAILVSFAKLVAPLRALQHTVTNIEVAQQLGHVSDDELKDVIANVKEHLIPGPEHAHILQTTWHGQPCATQEQRKAYHAGEFLPSCEKTHSQGSKSQIRPSQGPNLEKMLVTQMFMHFCGETSCMVPDCRTEHGSHLLRQRLLTACAIRVVPPSSRE